jgi:hypothetical protein
MLATLAQYKARYGISDTSQDTAIADVLAGVSAQLARAAGRALPDGRPCLEITDDVVTLTVRERYIETLWLPCWPVASISELLEGTSGDWASATTLTAGDDYVLDAGIGGIARLGCYWPMGQQVVRATYRGGYTPVAAAVAYDAEDTYAVGSLVLYGGAYWRVIQGPVTGLAPDNGDAEDYWSSLATLGEVELPGDIVDAALQQARWVMDRRAFIGQMSAATGGGPSAAFGADDLLPIVRTTMDRYRRMVG